jgi:hypothetical protein
VKRTITKPAKASFKGKVSPARPGATVSLEMKQGSAWKIVGRTKERADGSFIVKVGASATHVYRAFVGGVFGRYDQGSSASVKVTVKAP